VPVAKLPDVRGGGRGGDGEGDQGQTGEPKQTPVDILRVWVLQVPKRPLNVGATREADGPPVIAPVLVLGVLHRLGEALPALPLGGGVVLIGGLDADHEGPLGTAGGRGGGWFGDDREVEFAGHRDGAFD
jgi:hypothetical protein